MEVCLPWMGTPYGCGGGFGHAPQQAARTRGWEEEEDHQEDGREVRRRAEGEAPAMPFVASVFHGVPATAGNGAAGAGPAIGGMQLDAYQVHLGAPGGGVMGGQFGGGQRAPLAAHHAYLLEQQPLNAFQVLMSAAPIKVDGIVCMRYRARILPCVFSSPPRCSSAPFLLLAHSLFLPPVRGSFSRTFSLSLYVSHILSPSLLLYMLNNLPLLPPSCAAAERQRRVLRRRASTVDDTFAAPV
jgi:hypothetical protein